MTAFHAFVTGLAGRYSDVQQEKRNLAGQKELSQIELEKAALKNPTNSQTYGNMTFAPTQLPDGASADRIAYQGVADYANMFGANTQAEFDSLSTQDKDKLKLNLLGAWSDFTQLQSPGSGGSGDNIKEYYRMFPNLDAFSKMPDLHQQLLASDPTKSILGKVVYDSNHEILGINSNENGTPAIFTPEDDAMFKNAGADRELTGELTSIPSSLITTPIKWGGKYDFGGKKQEEKFYGDVQSILTSRQFGGMEQAQAQNLIDDKNRPWAAFAVYAAYGLDTDQLDATDYAKEMVELQQIYGMSDQELFSITSKGMMKYEIEPDIGGTQAKITRKWRDLTDSQVKAVNNALRQSNEIIEDTRKLADLWEKGQFLPGPLGVFESFARGVLTDDGSILKTLGLVQRDSQNWINFEGLDGSAADVAFGRKTFTSDEKEVGSLAWHIAGIQRSMDTSESSGDGLGKYYDYETDKWIHEKVQGEAEGYRAKRALEISLAYRLTVLEQGSGGNTISDKDFKVSLGKIRGGLASSKEQIIDGLNQILETASRGAVKSQLLAENEKSGQHLVTMYEMFRSQKELYWKEMEQLMKPYNDPKAHGGEGIDTLNEVMANKLKFLRNNLNFKLGIDNAWRTDNKGLFSDLRPGEMADVLGNDGFWMGSQQLTGNDTTTTGTDVNLGGTQTTGTETETGETFAPQGFIKLPSSVEKRPTVPIEIQRGRTGLPDEKASQIDLETRQKLWETNYGQFYNHDGSIKEGYEQVDFKTILPLLKTPKSKIIELIKTKKLPRPEGLPEQVHSRPVKEATYTGVGGQSLLRQQQKMWDLKYSKYYNPDGTLIKR